MSKEAENAAKKEAFAEGAPAAPENVVAGTEPTEDKKVPPLWEGWRVPTKPSEALKLGEEYARMEGLWCSGSLFELRSEIGDPDEDDQHYPGERGYVAPNGMTEAEAEYNDAPCACEACVKLRALVDRKEHGLSCGDIKACSVGILIMSVLDGPAVAQYFNPQLRDGADEEDYDAEVQDQLERHPVGGPSLVYLQAGMQRVESEIKAVSEEDREEAILDARRIINEFKNPKPSAPVSKPRGRKPFAVPATPKDPDALRHRLIHRALEDIISFNDQRVESGLPSRLSCDTTPGGKLHERIVLGFQYAKEFADQDIIETTATEVTDPPALES